MLRPKIKEYAERGDIVGLHYIFRDALDADPTFEYYLDSYRYCEEKVPNFFDAYRELTPFSQEPCQWDNAYWMQMKMDLMENFSKERYEHLRKVAQVYYAEKIQRIREEERQKNAVQKPIASPAPSKTVRSVATTHMTQKESDREFERRANQIREEAAKKNREAERHMAAQQKELDQARENSQKDRKKEEDDHTKKLMGAVLIVVIAAVVLFLLFRGSSSQPTQNQVAAVMTQNPAGRTVCFGLKNIM